MESSLTEGKQCTQCGYTKPLDQFYAQSANKDGLTTACKPCVRFAQRQSRNRANLIRMERERIKQEDLDNPGTKICSFCEVRLPLSEFYKNPSTKDGYQTVCKADEAMIRRTKNKAPKLKTRTAAHRAYDTFKSVWNTCKKKYRIPGWANQDLIYEVYKQSGEGMEVDHIVPLHGTTVCGLHVEYNLRIVTVTENRQKGNKWDEETQALLSQ